MPSKKPVTSLRRAPSGTTPSKRLEGADLTRALAEVGRKREKPHAAEEERAGRGIVTMPGRLRADGTRVGARQARRLTVYLSLEVADELEAQARKRRMSFSDVANEALAEMFGITIEGE